MLVKMICPQCGAALEFDNTRDFMFCQFCGMKIANVEKKIHLNISGRVEIDESGKIGNFIRVAENAMRAGNYQEAYTYCLRILEIDPRHLTANLYKGLAAVMMSTPERMRFTEGIVAFESAAASGQMNDRYLPDVIKIVGAINMTIPTLYVKYCDFKARRPLSGKVQALNMFGISYGITQFLTNVIQSVNDQLTAQANQLETGIKEMIKSVLQMAYPSFVELTFVSGYHMQQNKNGRIVTVTDYAKIKNPFASDVKRCIDYVKRRYNNTPSTLKQIGEYDLEISKRNAAIDNYNAALSAFFSVNPALGNAYRHPGLFGRSRKLAEVEKYFPPDLLNRKAWADAARTEIRQIEASKKKFLKDHTI